MVLQQRRLIYFGHVVRMGSERFPNIQLYGHISGTRPRGRPRKRWIDNAREDYESLGLSLVEADRFAKDRRNWNLVVSRAASARQPCWRRRGIKSSKSKSNRTRNEASYISRYEAPFDHITPTLRDRLHWLRVPQRIEFKRGPLVHKAIHGLAPAYIANYCIEIPSRRCLRSSAHRRLHVPPPSKTVMLGERSFSIGGPSLWNNLPDTVKEADTVELFKQRIKTHLFGHCYFIPIQS